MNTKEFFAYMMRNVEDGREFCYNITKPSDKTLNIRVDENCETLNKILLEVENSISFMEEMLEVVEKQGLHYDFSATTSSYGPDGLILAIYQDNTFEHAACIMVSVQELYHWACRYEPKQR